jgi:hypothetical protein
VGARAIEEEVLAIRRRVLGAEHPDTLTSMSNLAHTLWTQGDYAGVRAIHEEVLAIRRRVLGAEHPDTLTSMDNLATTLKALGDHTGARALEEEALSLKPVQPSTADPLELAFLLVMDSVARPTLLVRPDSEGMYQALTEGSKRHRRMSADHLLEALRERHGVIRPQPLWLAWMTKLHPDRVERLREGIQRFMTSSARTGDGR